MATFDLEPLGCVSSYSWLRYALDRNSSGVDISHLFAGAFTQAYFAHYYLLPEVMTRARSQYGKHLLLLKNILNRPTVICTEHLVQGIMTAVFFELLSVTSPEATKMHLDALAKIVEVSRRFVIFRSPASTESNMSIQSWGPHEFQSSLARISGLTMCRGMIVGLCLLICT